MNRTRLCSVAFLSVVLVASAGSLLAQSATDKSSVSTASDDTVYQPGREGVTIPKGVYMPPAEYSDRPRRKKIEGIVMLSMIITPEGRVRDAQVTQSLDKDLDKQALAAVAKWKFQPATKDGKHVAVRIMTEVNFRLY